jgi:hypothetical protein
MSSRNLSQWQRPHVSRTTTSRHFYPLLELQPLVVLLSHRLSLSARNATLLYVSTWARFDLEERYQMTHH